MEEGSLQPAAKHKTNPPNTFLKHGKVKKNHKKCLMLGLSFSNVEVSTLNSHNSQVSWPNWMKQPLLESPRCQLSCGLSCTPFGPAVGEILVKSAACANWAVSAASRKGLLLTYFLNT